MIKRLPVIVVSGFLGSGKTTLLRFLLKESKKKFGLIINEFGDVGIDGSLLKNCDQCNEDDFESIIELNNGCLCCTVQDDFIPSINTLLKSHSEIDAILIETSGLALPKPLLKALNWPEIRSSIYLKQVIGVVNGESMINDLPINDLKEIDNQYKDTNIIEHKSSIVELFEQQLEVSDLVIISRADILSDNEFESVKEKLTHKISPEIPIIRSLNGSIDLGFVFDSEIKTNYDNYLFDDHEHNHAELYSSTIKCNNYFLEKEEFEFVIKEILHSLNILRIKGRLWIPNKTLPLQIQIVGKKISTWFEDVEENCWRPSLNVGIELIMIGSEKESFLTVERKIKEKFKIVSNPKYSF